MLYTIILILHNLTRWAVVGTALYALYLAYRGWLGKRAWTDADRRPIRWFAIAMTVQFLWGLLFYFLPGSLANYGVSNFGVAMRDPQIRFFLMEHSVVMFVALSLSHMVGSVAAKGADATAKYRRAAILLSVTTLLVLLAIPWPFLSYGRPLFRIG